MLTKRRVPRSEEEYDLITLGNDLDITLVTDDQINGKILIRCLKKKICFTEAEISNFED